MLRFSGSSVPPGARTRLALALLCGEYLLQFLTLAVFHDGPVLYRLPGPWRVLQHGTLLAGYLSALVAAFFVVRARSEGPAASWPEPSRTIGALTLHLVSYGVCFALVTYVFARPDALAAWIATLMFCLWLVSGALSAASLYVWAHGRPRVGAGTLAGIEWRAVGLVAVLVCVAAPLVQDAWFDLAPVTLRLSGWMLGAAFSGVYAGGELGNTLGVEGFAVRITKECSGLDGMGVTAIFLSGHLWLDRKRLRFPHALLLLPFGVGLAYVLNAVRIAALVAVGALVSPEVAKGGFHANAGWLLCCTLSVLLVYASQRWLFVRRSSPQDGRPSSPDVPSAEATPAYLLPLVTLVAVGLVTGLFSSGTLDKGYVARFCAAGTVLWLYRREYLALGWRLSPFALGLGVAVAALWLWLQPTDAGRRSMLVQAELGQLSPVVRALWMGLRVVGGSLVIPLAEELAFRGYLQRRLIAPAWARVGFDRFSWLSFVVTALGFGALHSSWFAGTLAGAAFAWAVYRSGRLADAVLAHVTANTLLCGWALATGAWGSL